MDLFYRLANFTSFLSTKIHSANNGSGLQQYVNDLFDDSLSWEDISWLKRFERRCIDENLFEQRLESSTIQTVWNYNFVDWIFTVWQNCRLLWKEFSLRKMHYCASNMELLQLQFLIMGHDRLMELLHRWGSLDLLIIWNGDSSCQQKIIQ